MRRNIVNKENGVIKLNKNEGLCKCLGCGYPIYSNQEFINGFHYKCK